MGKADLLSLQMCGNSELVEHLVGWLRAWQPGKGLEEAQNADMSVAAAADAGDSDDADEEWLRVGSHVNTSAHLSHEHDSIESALSWIECVAFGLACQTLRLAALSISCQDIDATCLLSAVSTKAPLLRRRGQERVHTRSCCIRDGVRHQRLLVCMCPSQEQSNRTTPATLSALQGGMGRRRYAEWSSGSDAEAEASRQALCSAAWLSGPTGCGKSTAVTVAARVRTPPREDRPHSHHRAIERSSPPATSSKDVSLPPELHLGIDCCYERLLISTSAALLTFSNSKRAIRLRGTARPDTL